MGDYYTATGQQDVTTATPGDSSLSIAGVATARARVSAWTVSMGGTPADNAVRFIAQRFTAAGTNTGVTPAENDLDGPVALMVAGENHTVEPTYTASGELFDQLPNQRATYRHVLEPRGEWMIPASATGGIGWVGFHASYTGSIEVTASWWE